MLTIEGHRWYVKDNTLSASFMTFACEIKPSSKIQGYYDIYLYNDGRVNSVNYAQSLEEAVLFVDKHNEDELKLKEGE